MEDLAHFGSALLRGFSENVAFFNRIFKKLRNLGILVYKYLFTCAGTSA
jgi:hypothetical protein